MHHKVPNFKSKPDITSNIIFKRGTINQQIKPSSRRKEKYGRRLNSGKKRANIGYHHSEERKRERGNVIRKKIDGNQERMFLFSRTCE